MQDLGDICWQLNIANNQQSILSAMRRQQTRKSTQIMVFDKEENKFTNAFTLPSILSEFKLLSPSPNIILVPRIPSKGSIEEIYHDKVNSWIARQSQQDVHEIFTITEQSHVSKLLEMIKQAHEQLYGNSCKRNVNGFFVAVMMQAKVQRLFQGIKIAWTSNTVISFKPAIAMKWMQSQFGTENYFFPSEKTQLNMTDLEESQFSGEKCFQFLKILTQAKRSLAIYLRKAITLRCETSYIPSELAKVEKIKKYAQHHSICSQNTLNGLFQMPLIDFIEFGVPKNIRIIHRIEEEYFQHLEQQAQRLIKQLDAPVSNKPSKRSKRNMKKAEAAKMKKEQSRTSSQNTSSLSINPEQVQVRVEVVEENTYKIGEHEEANLTMDSLIQEPKQQINTQKMFADHFVPPSHSRNGSDQTVHDQNDINAQEEGKKSQNRRRNKKKYEQKATHPIQFMDVQFQVQKVATDVVQKLLQTKLFKLQAQNKQINQLKTNAYKKLLSYFAVRLPCFSVNIFGSLSSGVSLPSSDIDILLTPQVPLYIDDYFLSDLANDLQTFGWVTYGQAILTAKIPVIKLIIDPYVCEAYQQSQLKYYSHEEQLNTPFLIKFDITLNTSGQNNTGLVSTAYMQNIFNFRPRLIEAMLIIKNLLQKANLNQGYKGGISSYNIFLMMICFAQHSHFSFDATLTEFLSKFFRFYGKEFDYQNSVLRYECGQNCVISCKEYSLLPNSESIASSSVIKMIDPINGKLVRASFSRFEDVLDLFRQLAQAFGGVIEEVRIAVQSLMGKANRRRGEIAAIAHDRNLKSRVTLEALLLID